MKKSSNWQIKLITGFLLIVLGTKLSNVSIIFSGGALIAGLILFFGSFVTLIKQKITKNTK